MTASVSPKILSEDILSNPKKWAEISVYNILRDALPNEFHVFYNCEWLDKSGKNSSEDGEADFVVAHEKFGFIVLEVKGGVISRDENTRQWYSRGEGGKVYKIKDPVKQARTSKHVILDKIKTFVGPKLGFIRTKHAVVFPHSSKPKSEADLGADMPLDIFFFKEDMPNLGAKIFKMLLNDPPGAKFSPLGPRGIESLQKLFSKGFNFEPSLLAMIKSCEFKILEATDQQKKLLKQLENNDRMLISGGAGTGKTSLGVEKAKHLASSGKSVLLLCFNAPLVQYLKNILNAYPMVDVFTFHQLCIKAANDSGMPLQPRKTKEDWDNLPYVLLEALEKNPDYRYDAIIVDEGQDFDTEWLESLNLCLKNPEKGIFYIFYDDNQRIYKKDLSKLLSISGASFRLFENIRNSKPIFSASKTFYNGGLLESLGPEGIEIEWIESEKQNRDKRLEKLLNKLVNNEGIAESEIAVLTAKSYESYPKLSVGKYDCRRADDPTTDKIVLDSIYRFKGLEKEVVILIDLNTAIDNTQLLYVGFSRARSLLMVVDTMDAIGALKAQITALV